MWNCFSQNLRVGLSSLLLFLAAPLLSPAQTFSNSATLTAGLDKTGTNFLVNFSMGTNQGWVTLFAANSASGLATNGQPIGLVAVPNNSQGQFVVPINSDASVQFYKLLVEQWPSHGQMLVFTNGPFNFAAMIAPTAASPIARRPSSPSRSRFGSITLAPMIQTA